MSLTLQQKLTRFRPIVCRLLARRKVSANSVIALTDEEIAMRSRLPIWWIKGLSWKHDWSGIPDEVKLPFMAACGIDLDDRRALERSWQLWDKGSGHHLRRSPLWKPLFLPLVQEARRIKDA